MPDPINVANINDLRRAVDNYRLAIGLPRGGWTNDPITRATPIRDVHFTELRVAMQQLWDYNEQGAIPPWTAGSPPNVSRSVQASDDVDLPTWMDGTDPAPAVVGINVNPNQQCASPSIAVLQATKFQGIRLVPRNNTTNRNYISAALRNYLR